MITIKISKKETALMEKSLVLNIQRLNRIKRICPSRKNEFENEIKDTEKILENLQQCCKKVL